MPMWASSRTSRVTCCVFDLAGTLFWSPEFDRAAYSNAVLCLAAKQNISHSEAQARLEARRSDLSSQAGFTVALSAAVSTFGIEADLWAEYQTDVDLDSVLTPDPDVAQMVSRLYGRYYLVMYTNICRPLLTRTLEHLHLANIWNELITPREAGGSKPVPAFCRSLLSRLQIPEEYVLTIGDRADVDLLPFTTLGAGGYLVSDRDDLLLLLSDLDCEAAPSAGWHTDAREQTPRTALP